MPESGMPSIAWRAGTIFAPAEETPVKSTSPALRLGRRDQDSITSAADFDVLASAALVRRRLGEGILAQAQIAEKRNRVIRQVAGKRIISARKRT